jgi:hypothetical protein
MYQSSKTLKMNQTKKKTANGASSYAKEAKQKSCRKPPNCEVYINAQGLYEWKTEVTEAMARRTKTQVLVTFTKLLT